MENLDLIELQKQLDSITSGEWTATSDETSVFDHSVVIFPHGTVLARHIERKEDREFIAAAPATIRKLMGWLAEVWESRLLITRERDATIRGLQERIKELETQLSRADAAECVTAPIEVGAMVRVKKSYQGEYALPAGTLATVTRARLKLRDMDSDYFIYWVDADDGIEHSFDEDDIEIVTRDGEK